MSVHNQIALIMGIANSRSIAYSCAKQFLQKGWRVIFTCQDEKILSKTDELLRVEENVMGGFVCDVLQDLDGRTSTSSMSPFQQRLADILQDEPISSVVHSLAHAPNLKTNSLLDTTREDYLRAHEISAFSLIDATRQVRRFLDEDMDTPSRSITALSYLGATRAIPGYNVMGPAKASLESIVRGLASEVAPSIRVNAVSAGPLPTLSARGGIADFAEMRREMDERAPLGNITAEQVSSTVQFLSSNEASGITGQTVYVDGGYSIVGGPSRLKGRL